MLKKQSNPSQLKIPLDIFFMMFPREHQAVIVNDLQNIQRTLRDVPLIMELNHPLTKRQRLLLWENLLQKLEVHSFLRHYILALTKLDLLKNIELIIQHLLKKLDTHTVDIFVTTACPLTIQSQEHIVQQLKNLTSYFHHKNFQWHIDIDRHLLGGYIVSSGAYWLDLSVRTQLKKLEHQVKQS